MNTNEYFVLNDLQHSQVSFMMKNIGGKGALEADVGNYGEVEAYYNSDNPFNAKKKRRSRNGHKE